MHDREDAKVLARRKARDEAALVGAWARCGDQDAPETEIEKKKLKEAGASPSDNSSQAAQGGR